MGSLVHESNTYVHVVGLVACVCAYRETLKLQPLINIFENNSCLIFIYDSVHALNCSSVVVCNCGLVAVCNVCTYPLGEMI